MDIEQLITKKIYNRSEYAKLYLILFIVGLVLPIIPKFIPELSFIENNYLLLVLAIYAISFIIVVRRGRDLDINPYTSIIANLIPIVNFIYSIYLLFAKSKNSETNNDSTEPIDPFKTSPEEERIYSQIKDELEKDIINEALWIKAQGQSNGDEVKQKSIYIQLRAKSIIQDKEHQSDPEFLNEKFKTLKNNLQEAKNKILSYMKEYDEKYESLDLDKNHLKTGFQEISKKENENDESYEEQDWENYTMEEKLDYILDSWDINISDLENHFRLKEKGQNVFYYNEKTKRWTIPNEINTENVKDNKYLVNTPESRDINDKFRENFKITTGKYINIFKELYLTHERLELVDPLRIEARRKREKKATIIKTVKYSILGLIALGLFKFGYDIKKEMDTIQNEPVTKLNDNCTSTTNNKITNFQPSHMVIRVGQLYEGVYEKENNQLRLDKTLKYLNTGELVMFISYCNIYSKIQTSDGVIGYVANNIIKLN